MARKRWVGGLFAGDAALDLAFELAADVALNHHERWDGTGYPHGLAGDRIPESARIVAIADVFDALASRRPYKEAWPVDVVVAKIIESRGTHFDPAMTDAFVACLPKILEVKAYWDRQEGDAAGGLDPIQEEA